MTDFNDLLKKMEPKTLEQGFAKANAFAKTAEGKAMIEELKKNQLDDAEELLKILQKNPEVKQKIESFLKK